MITKTIEKYIQGIIDDKYHRYKSWDYCYQAFGVPTKAENQVLELAFYLASWGMYRGSGGLLQKNHLIHKGAVDIIFYTNSQKLRCSSNTEISRNNISDILQVKKILGEHYSSIPFIRGSEKIKPISATDTLLSKVMLGTLGCVPAYDRYFIEGLREMKLQHSIFNASSLNELFTFFDKNKSEIQEAQKLILEKTKSHYPLMKILDMYFWQTGYDKELMAKSRI